MNRRWHSLESANKKLVSESIKIGCLNSCSSSYSILLCEYDICSNLRKNQDSQEKIKFFIYFFVAWQCRCLCINQSEWIGSLSLWITWFHISNQQQHHNTKGATDFEPPCFLSVNFSLFKIMGTCLAMHLGLLNNWAKHPQTSSQMLRL